MINKPDARLDGPDNEFNAATRRLDEIAAQYRSMKPIPFTFDWHLLVKPDGGIDTETLRDDQLVQLDVVLSMLKQDGLGRDLEAARRQVKQALKGRGLPY